MKKTLKAFNIVISVFALIAVTFAILGTGLDLFGYLKNGSFSIITDPFFLSVLIALPFTITELKNGVDLIKLTKKDSVNDSLKPIIGLVNSIVGVFAALTTHKVIMLFKYAIENKAMFDLMELKPFLFGIIIVAVARTTTTLLRRNSYGKMAFFGIFFSLISFIYLCTVGLFKLVGYLELIQNICNMIVVILVFVYSIIAAVYYVKNKDDINQYETAGKDFEVIKQVGPEKQKIRVFLQRKGEGSVAAIVFYMLAFVFYIAFVAVYFYKTMGSTFIIDFATFDFGSTLSAFDFALVFGLLFTLPYLVVGAVGIFVKDSFYYKNTIMIASSIIIVYLSSTLSFVNLFYYAAHEVIALEGNIDESVLIILNTVLNVVPMIANFVLLIIAKFQYSKLDDGMKNGDTYYANIHRAKKFTILYFVASILMLIGPILNWAITNDAGSMPYLILFVLFMLMLLIAVCIHSKHPLEESYISYRKIGNTVPSEEKPSEDESEFAEAIPVDEDN